MRPDDWHITEDLDYFLARAGDFLRAPGSAHHAADGDRDTANTRGGRVRRGSPRLRPSGASGRGLCHLLLLSHPARPPEPHPPYPRACRHARRPPGRPRPPPPRRQRGARHRHRFRRGLAAAHRRNADTPRAAPPVPPRHAHPAGAAPRGPGPTRGRAGPQATQVLVPRVRRRHRRNPLRRRRRLGRHASPTDASPSGRPRTALPSPWRA